MTNYDKIRNMTIEEMATLLQHLVICNMCKNDDCSQSCNDGIKQWLESEAE